jgi:hypothetical protein
LKRKKKGEGGMTNKGKEREEVHVVDAAFPMIKEVEEE